MGHRLAITKIWFNRYGVPNETVPLGDLDGNGLRAKELFRRHFDDLFWEAPASDHKIRFESWTETRTADSVGAMFKAGEGGIEAELFDEDLTTTIQQRTAEMYEAPLVLAYAVLPNTHHEGWLVTHAFYNRYFKAGLLRSLAQGVGDVARALEPRLKLNLASWAPAADLAKIIEEGRVTGFSLQEPPNVDHYTPAGMPSTEIKRLRLDFVPDRGRQFSKDPFLKAATDNNSRLELLTIDDETWGEASIQVDTTTGPRRFILGDENKEWFSWDVTETVGKGQPTAEDLVEAAVDLLFHTNRVT